MEEDVVREIAREYSEDELVIEVMLEISKNKGYNLQGSKEKIHEFYNVITV